jgi:hypothetical protein
MVKTILIMTILWLYYVNGGTPNNNQVVCSAFCKPGSCTWFSSDECSSCNSNGWGGSPSCDITDPAYALLDYSGDAGGSIVVTPGAETTKCPGLLAYTTAYGEYKAEDIVTIELLGGT